MTTERPTGPTGPAPTNCARNSNLFREWKKKDRCNKESPGLPGPGEQATPLQGTPIPAERSTTQTRPTPIDPLYTGRLTGTVPASWTPEGWLAATKDRLRRTNDPFTGGRLSAEIERVELEVQRKHASRLASRKARG